MLQQEKTIPSVFQPVPEYYIEISQILLRGASEIFGSELGEVGAWRHTCACVLAARASVCQGTKSWSVDQMPSSL